MRNTPVSVCVATMPSSETTSPSSIATNHTQNIQIGSSRSRNGHVESMACPTSVGVASVSIAGTDMAVASSSVGSDAFQSCHGNGTVGIHDLACDHPGSANCGESFSRASDTENNHKVSIPSEAELNTNDDAGHDSDDSMTARGSISGVVCLNKNHISAAVEHRTDVEHLAEAGCSSSLSENKNTLKCRQSERLDISNRVGEWLRRCLKENDTLRDGECQAGENLKDSAIYNAVCASNLSALPADDCEQSNEDEDEHLLEISQAGHTSLSIQELLSQGCKLLNIEDSKEDQPEEDSSKCFQPDIEYHLSHEYNEKELDAETSSSDSSFCISPDNIKRSASLKTGKTPPGTPSRKKFVRFADAMGLELQQIRTFKDEIPVIPASVMQRLSCNDYIQNDNRLLTFRAMTRQCYRRLQPLFQPPSATPGFLDRLHMSKVVLENIICREEDSLVRCIVRVLNMGFEKRVVVRYTMDEWSTWSERAASYMPYSSDGQTDRFQTAIYCSTLCAGQRLQLAIAFYCLNREYWDNNNGLNYCIECVMHPENIGQSSPEEWTGGQI